MTDETLERLEKLEGSTTALVEAVNKLPASMKQAVIDGNNPLCDNVQKLIEEIRQDRDERKSNPK